MSGIELTLCPKCGESTAPFLGFEGGLIYDCKACGYHGSLTITAKSREDADEIRKKLAKNK